VEKGRQDVGLTHVWVEGRFWLQSGGIWWKSNIQAFQISLASSIIVAEWFLPLIVGVLPSWLVRKNKERPPHIKKIFLLQFGTSCEDLAMTLKKEHLVYIALFIFLALQGCSVIPDLPGPIGIPGF